MKDSNLTDDDDSRMLLINARNGDQSSLWRLTENFRPYLKAVVLDQLGDRFQHRVGDSDVVQQAMTAAVRRFDQFRGGSINEWRAWLTTIAKNEATTVARFEKRQRRDAGREVALPTDSRIGPSTDAPGALSAAVHKEETRDLLMAIERLSVIDQEVIRLRNFEALSHSEIARRLGITESTARKRWSDALKRLSEMLRAAETTKESTHPD